MKKREVHISLKNVKEAKMSSNAPMYVYATENVAGYYKALGLKNKKVITVCGSGDQFLNALYFGAGVIGFDLNKRSEFITRLKITAILELNYNEFLEFFGEHKPNVGFNFVLYKKIRISLDKSTRKFFDGLYKKFNYNGLKLIRSNNFRQRDDFGYGSIKRINIYLRNARNYDYMKSILKNKGFEFILEDATHLSRNRMLRGKRYDLINLSNVPTYVIGSLRKSGSEDPVEEVYNSIFLKLKKFLLKHGKILF
ncbi:DUF3419 family protein, partial [Candidatus Pacearchaeota archaeon]|nr:DUF3419 family protein [Candidatus Pacearchaeota archaeon]